MISGQSSISPEHVLAPQVRVHTAFVHGCVRFEVLFNVELVLLDGQLDVLRVSINGQDPVEVTADAILLVVEAVIIGASDRVNVLGHKLANHTP